MTSPDQQLRLEKPNHIDDQSDLIRDSWDLTQNFRISKGMDLLCRNTRTMWINYLFIHHKYSEEICGGRGDGHKSAEI